MNRRTVVAGALLMLLVIGAGCASVRRTREAKDTSPVGPNERGIVMNGYVQDIESLAIKNSEFRRVLYTAKHGIEV